MADLKPAQYQSVPDLRDAITRGDITVHKAFVYQVRVGGTPTGLADVRGVADTISYDVRVVDTKLLIQSSALDNMKPYNRAYTQGWVRAAKVGDYMELVQYGSGLPQPNALRLYHQGTEKPDPRDCDGNQLEPA